LDISYSGLAAELYDLWWVEKTLEDEAFYGKMLKQCPGLALEVGCGTGRLLLPYLQAGFAVEGVDCALEMLKICQQKAEHEKLAPILYEQFMQDLDLPRRYKTIYIPFRSFQLMSDRDDALKSLQSFYAHLEAEGQLLVSIGIPWDSLTGTNQGTWKIYQTAIRPSDGATVLCSGTTIVNRVEQVQTHWNRYEIYKQGQLIKTEMKQSKSRWYFKHEFILMLEKAGFHTISTYGDYADIPATEQHSTIIFRAWK
jgi:SAM-dependent methyltransferase